tara:strand:- start:1520 stop:1624 length:105 start_codon:yes stop_codon:yes gene_type:complete
MPISMGAKAIAFNGMIAVISIIDLYKLLSGIKKK